MWIILGDKTACGINKNYRGAVVYQCLGWTISPLLSAHGWQTNVPVIRRTQSCGLRLVNQWLSVSSLVRGTSCNQWSQPSPWSQGFILNSICSKLGLLFIFLFFVLPLSRRVLAKRVRMAMLTSVHKTPQGCRLMSAPKEDRYVLLPLTEKQQAAYDIS